MKSLVVLLHGNGSLPNRRGQGTHLNAGSLWRWPKVSRVVMRLSFQAASSSFNWAAHAAQAAGSLNRRWRIIRPYRLNVPSQHSLHGPYLAQDGLSFWSSSGSPLRTRFLLAAGANLAGNGLVWKRGQEWANLGTFSSCDTYVCRPFLLSFCLLNLPIT
jgi:hypothetical protein